METPSLIYTHSPTEFWVRKLVPAFKMSTCFAHMERHVYEWKRGRERWGTEQAGFFWVTLEKCGVQERAEMGSHTNTDSWLDLVRVS